MRFQIQYRVFLMLYVDVMGSAAIRKMNWIAENPLFISCMEYDL